MGGGSASSAWKGTGHLCNWGGDRGRGSSCVFGEAGARNPGGPQSRRSPSPFAHAHLPTRSTCWCFGVHKHQGQWSHSGYGLNGSAHAKNSVHRSATALADAVEAGGTKQGPQASPEGSGKGHSLRLLELP